MSLKDLKKEAYQETVLDSYNEWYRLNSILGNTWAKYYAIIGGRQTGKTVAAQEFIIQQWRQKNRKFVWIRLSKSSVDKLLANDAVKFFEAPLRRKYNLDICRVGNGIYEVYKRDEKGKVLKKKLMGEVYALSEMAKLKGIAEYDYEYKNWSNCIVDEFVLERNERRMFDVAYNLGNTLETLYRDKDKVRIIMLCNYCSDISDVLGNFNFLPETFGRYALKNKGIIIDYMEPSQKYKDFRKRAVSTMMLGNDSGNFNNQAIERDKTLLFKGDRGKPECIIKFTLEKSGWFILWTSGCITRYKNETINRRLPMTPYLDEVFNVSDRDMVIARYDMKGFYYRDMITQIMFEKMLKELAPRGNK